MGFRWRNFLAQRQGLGGAPSGGTTAIVWQDYTPHPEDGDLQNEYVWVSPACDTAGVPLNEEEPISSGLQKLLFLYPGAIEDIGTDIGRQFVPLVTMGRQTGTVRFDDCVTRNLFGQMDLRSRAQIKEFERPTGDPYILAAALRIEAESEPADEDVSQPESERAAAIKVVLVSDMDILAGVFLSAPRTSQFFWRAFAKWQVDNVPFILNILDDLAEDTPVIDIRKRRPVHRELTAIKQVSDAAKRNRDSARKEAGNKLTI